MQKLFDSTATEQLTSEQVHLAMQDSSIDELLASPEKIAAPQPESIQIKTRFGSIKGRGINQQDYLRKITSHDINFGVGPAGTGKTYLAVACAVDALQHEKVRKIILVRPAVEAGEKLGFLPGDMAQKVDPYLRPLYDALYEMLGFDRVEKMIEKGQIEVAPLAFMRGRTLNDSFIILDEAQNTTVEQIKMFLTRVGFGSTAVITGDVTQIDLPSEKMSGLRHVLEVLKDVEGISFTFFGARDVVRHPLVQRIVSAYEAYEKAREITS
jgi:phosphate starvation-inducible PhoH-like protein